jgi:Uma2 family endonuclease
LITDINQLDLDKKYNYAEYLTWRFKERVELIMGKIFKMSPAPTATHQGVSMLIVGAFFNYLKGKSCRVFHAPFDVRLSKTSSTSDKDVETVVQPDICVICDLAKIDEKGCNGAPDLIVEITSKSSVQKDLHEKYELYEQVGVKEYWIVYPTEKSLTVFILENGKYIPSKPMTTGDIVRSNVLPDLNLDLEEIFQDIVQEPQEDYNIKQVRLDP